MTSTTEPQIVMEPVEHHDPLGHTDYLSLEHLERYRFAHDRVQPGMRVLDIACGAGYGTGMLVERGCDVAGADYDAQTVELAAFRIGGAEFRTADALDLPFAAESFDAVVTFETIEHVRDGWRFLTEMQRVLRPGGTLICSTPNIAYTRHPEYHVHEYAPLEFFELIDDVFEPPERHGQYIRTHNRLRDLYSWRVKPHVLAVADRTGARPLLKKLLKRGAPSPAAPTTPQGALDYQQRIRAFLDRDPDANHRVQPYRTDHLLRIMVAVAKKAGVT